MKRNRNIFIGGAWPYANSTLHVGHLTALLGGDVLARYFRQNKNNVVYVSGSDCHGTPITLRAIEEEKTPQEIASRFHHSFLDVFKKLDFAYDLYGNTTDKDHEVEVHKLLIRLYENGNIYEKEEDQIFCESCNKFLNDREIYYHCPICNKVAKGEGCDCGYVPTFEILLGGNCSICNASLTSKKDKNLYFALTRFQIPLEDYVSRYGHRWRLNARNETKKYLKMGLIDRAITRNLDWGISVPFKGYENKKVYVWIEAVMGYISTCKKYCNQNNLNWREFLLKGGSDFYYMVHGKDNIIFHTIIYPAILLGLEENYMLPSDIVSSEFLTLNGEKISKSSGNYMEIDDILALGDSDTLRFYIMGYGAEKKDSDFTLKDYSTVHNNEIVNKFANFINRTLKFKNLDTIKTNKIDRDIQVKIEETYEEVGQKIEQYEFKEASKLILNLTEYANKYYDENKPWILFKEKKDKFNEVMYNCLILIINLTNLYAPFMPKTAKKLSTLLEFELNWKFSYPLKDFKLENFTVLFEKIRL